MNVVGIGGLYVACAEPDRVREWYRRHLDLRFTEDGGARFAWTHPDTGTVAVSELGFLDEASPRFDPGRQPFVIRYLVRDRDPQADPLEGRDWILDPDGWKAEFAELTPSTEPPADHGAVEGIGGVFFRSPNPGASKAWYEKVGIRPGADGYVTFPARSVDETETLTVWEVFPADTTYFDSRGESSPHPFMLNLRVRKLDELVESLGARGVWVDPNREAYEYGKFAWILDPLGGRIELWEPPSAAS
ncbi:MAG: hypothetical protein OXJ54_06900 [Gemmatimonadetes bacterium]|nr:hypothetical protein [Candidatus Palauibacter rhopaloidicola]